MLSPDWYCTTKRCVQGDHGFIGDPDQFTFQARYHYVGDSATKMRTITFEQEEFDVKHAKTCVRFWGYHKSGSGRKQLWCNIVFSMSMITVQ